LVVDKRLELLHAQGLLTLDGSSCIQLQFLADACNVWRSTHTSGTIVVIKVIYNDTNALREGRGVNGVANNHVVAFWLGDDTHESMSKAAKDLPAQLADMVRDGVTVTGINVPVALCLGGDMKFKMSLMGLSGCSSTYPCLYCYCIAAELHLSMKEWEEKGGLEFRSYATQMQLAHMHMPESYKCPAPGCNKEIKPGGPQFLPDEKGRLKWQKMHKGTRPGLGPKVCMLLYMYACVCKHMCV
jgi:hypothetical protein